MQCIDCGWCFDDCNGVIESLENHVIRPQSLAQNMQFGFGWAYIISDLSNIVMLVVLGILGICEHVLFDMVRLLVGLLNLIWT